MRGTWNFVSSVCEENSQKEFTKLDLKFIFKYHSQNYKKQNQKKVGAYVKINFSDV